jgi:plasmid rolling circle replication initiator protein Rep
MMTESSILAPETTLSNFEVQMIISLIIKVNNNKTNYHLHLHIGLLLGKDAHRQKSG